MENEINLQSFNNKLNALKEIAIENGFEYKDGAFYDKDESGWYINLVYNTIGYYETAGNIVTYCNYIKLTENQVNQYKSIKTVEDMYNFIDNSNCNMLYGLSYDIDSDDYMDKWYFEYLDEYGIISFETNATLCVFKLEKLSNKDIDDRNDRCHVRLKSKLLN